MAIRRLVFVCGVATAVGYMSSAGAQSPAFDVASVKPSNPTTAGASGRPPVILPALGRLTAQNVTLRMLVITAFQKQPFEVVGGPGWQNTDRFDITAKTDDATITTDQTLARLRRLLVDRFQLKVHSETQEVPV